jgi:hypothetical protein
MKWTQCVLSSAKILALLAVLMIATSDVANAGHHKVFVQGAPAVCAPAAPAPAPPPPPPPSVCAPAASAPPPPVCGPADKAHVVHSLFKHHWFKTVYYYPAAP